MGSPSDCCIVDQRERQHSQENLSTITCSYCVAYYQIPRSMSHDLPTRKVVKIEDKKNAFDLVAESGYGTGTHARIATTKS